MKSIKYIFNRRSPASPIWLTIYSDLMTNLMLFFLLMYGLSIMPEETREKIIEGLETKFKPQMTETKLQQVVDRIKEEEVIKRMQHYIMSANLRKYARVQIDEKRIRIILQTPILFELGGSVLKPDAQHVLREVARVLRVLDKPMVVEGHTDDTPIVSGSYDSNRELSLARSLAVLRFLQYNGINPENLRFAGYGEWRPLYPNDTALGRSLNRRVEIHVLREVIDETD